MRTLASVLAATLLASCGGHAQKPNSAEIAARAEADALYAEGRTLYDALESEKDIVKARSLFEKSCDLGSGAGCLYLAVMWDKGQGGLEDPDLAVLLLERACNLGEGGACTMLYARCRMLEVEKQPDPRCSP